MDKNTEALVAAILTVANFLPNITDPTESATGQWPTADPTGRGCCAPAGPAKIYALVLSECRVR
jgi:hypothetical protein